MSSQPSSPSTIQSGKGANDAYVQAFEQLKTNLRDLANPRLQETLVAILNQPRETVWDYSRGIQQFCKDAAIPPMTLKCIALMDQAIVSRLNETTSVALETKAVQGSLVTLASEINEIAQGRIKELQIDKWNELDLVLKAHDVQKLDNSDVLLMFTHIARGQSDPFKEFFKALIENQKVSQKRLDEYSNEVYKKNWITLVIQVVKKKPTTNEGLMQYLNIPDKERRDFSKNTLYVTNPQLKKTHSGVVLRCDKISNHQWVFHLHDESIVHVNIEANVFAVSITSKPSRCGLWKAIALRSVEREQTIEIGTPKDEKITGIKAGVYFYKTYSHRRPGAVAGAVGKAARAIPFAGRLATKLMGEETIEVELWDERNRTPCYRLTGIRQDNLVIKVYIEKWSVEEGDYTDSKAFEIDEFNRIFSVLHRTKESCIGLTLANADANLRIRDERDKNNNEYKLAKLKEIDNELETVRQLLIDDVNSLLLENLLNSMMAHQLQDIDVQVLKSHNQKLGDKIDQLVRRYKDDCEITRAPNELLFRLVLEVNQAKLVKKQENLSVATTMELLKLAFDHIKKIENQEIVLVVGNTGAGKSTSIGYFLGGQFAQKTNGVGDAVYEYSSVGAPLPKIGQALGTSETLYAQAFGVEDQQVLLCDCPGFNDTRGGQYELCTNLSIDMAIEKCSTLKAIVVVVPVIAFLGDRGNNIVELISTIQDRFPSTFKVDKPRDSHRLFLLVTKTNQALASQVDGLRQGARFREHLAETDTAIEALMEKGVTDGNQELEAYKMRRNIWQTMEAMRNEGRVNFIDIDDETEREELLRAYCNPLGSIDKDKYRKAMEGPGMKRKFGQAIELSTHTWTQTIFKNYFEAIPENIGIATRSLTKCKNDLRRLLVDKKERGEKIETLTQEITEIEAFIAELESNNGQDVDPALLLAFQARASDLTLQQIASEEANLSTENRKLEGLQEELRNATQKVTDLENQIIAADQTITALESEIAALKVGHTLDRLFKSPDYKKSDLWEMHCWKPGAREERVKKVEARTQEDEGDVVYEGLAGDYKGKTSDIAVIERKYKLFPADESTQKLFKEATWQSSQQLGDYTAIVKGEGCVIDARNVTPEGTKVAYSYVLTWDKKVMPWIEISHNVPNLEYNRATIINRNATKEAQEVEVKAPLEQRKIIAEAEVVNIQAALTQTQQDVTRVEAAIAALNATKKTQEIALLIEQKREEVERKMAEKTGLENSRDIDEKMEIKESEKLRLQEEILALKLKKRNYAIIIKTQENTLSLLLEFSELIAGPIEKDAKADATVAAVVACQEYITAYRKYQPRLDECLKEDLPFLKSN